MFIYGLFPFLLGIPIMLCGAGHGVAPLRAPDARARRRSLCVLALALFYSHVFPFGIFCIGFAAMFPWTKPARWLRAARARGSGRARARVVDASSPRRAGSSRGAATDNAGDPHAALDAAIGDIPNWFTNVFRDTQRRGRSSSRSRSSSSRLGLSQGDTDASKPVARAYALLPLACIVLYFLLPEGHGYIWLIAQRFPILFAITRDPARAHAARRARRARVTGALCARGPSSPS